MLSKPNFGFIDIELSETKNEYWTVGNLINTPLELLEACVQYLKQGISQTVEMDLEEYGSGYLLLDSESKNCFYYSTSDLEMHRGIPVIEFATNLRDDISDSVRDYSHFYYAATEKDEEIFEEKLEELCKLLKER